MADQPIVPLPQWVRDRRTRLGLTQPELSKKMGRERSTVSHIERGRSKRPTLPTMSQLATALESDLGTMLTETGLLASYAAELESEQLSRAQEMGIAFIKNEWKDLDPDDAEEAIQILEVWMRRKLPSRAERQRRGSHQTQGNGDEWTTPDP
jgi:transcriptional regulator with XRE-family HTH domain